MASGGKSQGCIVPSSIIRKTILRHVAHGSGYCHKGTEPLFPWCWFPSFPLSFFSVLPTPRPHSSTLESLTKNTAHKPLSQILLLGGPRLRLVGSGLSMALNGESIKKRWIDVLSSKCKTSVHQNVPYTFFPSLPEQFKPKASRWGQAK